MNFFKKLFGIKSESEPETNNSVKIGNQIWMVKNLNVDKFRNGDPIPYVESKEEWEKAGKEGEPACCYYGNYEENGKVYGKLYNWFALNDPRGLTPDGWHVPTDGEWKELEVYLGMSQSEADADGKRSTGLGGKLKESGSSHWGHLNNDSSNESGFTALPGGHRFRNGGFLFIGETGFWWSNTEDGTGSVWFRMITKEIGGVTRSLSSKDLGFSVRCLRD